MSEIVAMPKLGFDMAEGTLVRWVKQEGDAVKKGEVLAEIETDKATVEVEASASGVVAAHFVAEGTSVPIGQPIAVIAAPGEKVDLSALTPPASLPAGKAQPGERPGVRPPSPETGSFVSGRPEGGPGPALSEVEGVRAASPIARKMASDAGVDIRLIRGSGPGGRIVKRDVEAFLTSGAPAGFPVGAPSRREPSGRDLTRRDQIRADEEIPLTRLRQIIGRRMVESKQSAPHFYVTMDVDMAAAMGLRGQLNALVPESEKISVNDFIIKAAALALRQFPNLNSAVSGDKLIRRGRVNVGVAVAVEGGLITPVVQDADVKSLAQIAVESRALVGRAREGKIKPADIEGGTFTVSNLGMFDVEEFIAILNPPEVAILAVGSVRQTPVVKDGALAAGTRMKATLSADHRASDGAEAARFLQAFRVFLEAPLRLLL